MSLPMMRPDKYLAARKCRFYKALLAVAAGLAFCACSARPAQMVDPAAPPADYVRRIMVVVERSDFSPVAGALIKVEVEAPARLVSPADGLGRTNRQGGLELVFEPRPHYDQAAMKGGDIIVDFPVKATLTVTAPGRPPFTRIIDDRETYARYADPLYQGLARDPETGVTYYAIKAQ